MTWTRQPAWRGSSWASVSPVDAGPSNVASAATSRRFALRLREEAGRYDDRPGYRLDAEGIEAPRLSPGPTPGPVLTLVRGEPVEVM